MSKRWMVLLAAMFTVLMVATVLTAARPGQARDNETLREIHVSGEGTVTLKPDTAYVSLGVETVANTAREAQQKNNAAAAKIIQALRGLGISEDDIATQDFQLYPERRYDSAKQQDVIIGYRAGHMLRVTVRNIDQTGPVIDALMSAGGNMIQDISFGLKDSAAARDQALEKAVKEATRKAEAIARAAGVRLGGISQIIDTTGSGYQPPVTLRKEMAMAAADTAVAPGSVDIRASVQIIFKF